MTTEQDKTREELSKMEDAILRAIDSFMKNDRSEGDRWLAIGRTDIQKGFMAVKRGIYEGKRVGDA